MQNTRAEKNSIAARAIASQTAGKSGNSMPAVPVLQNKPVAAKIPVEPGQKAEEQAPAQGKLVNDNSPIQLKLERWKPKEFEATPGTKKNKEELAHTAANKVSAAVDQAYTEVEANNLTDANLPYQALYLLRLKEYQAGNKTMHPSTAAGYIIESKVNNRLAGETGFNFQTTGMLNGTRPDITVDLGDEEYALIDITAEKSLGHIFMKKGNWINHGHIPYVAEAWYQSLSFTGKAERLSPEQEALAVEAARNKRELADLMRKEKAEYKTEHFLSTQDRVLGHLAAAGRRAHQYLLRRPRDMAALKAVGIDISDDANYLIKTSIEARNRFLDIPIATEENPAPKFTETSIAKAISVIDYAKRAVPTVRPLALEPEKKLKSGKFKGGKWRKKLGGKKK